MAGCGRTDTDQPTESPAAADDAAEDFRAAIDRIDGVEVQTISVTGTTWTVEYATEQCCGDPFAAQQARLVRNFSEHRPRNVSLTVTAFHECTEIHWRVPAQLASKHRRGAIDTETYVNRVRNSTRRENKC